MTKKLLVFLLLGMFMISFASALDIISVTPLEKVGVDWDNVDSFLKDKTTSAYGKYEIRNSVLGIPFLQLSKVADIELINNSDVCGIDCFAEKEITLYNDGILIDDITFETRQKDGSWIYQDIRNYQFSYQGEIQDYKTVCTLSKEINLNGTQTETCEQVEDGTHIGKINYQEGDVVRAGNYLLRLDGQKKPTRTVDWKVKSNGIWTTDWAVWGASGDLSSGLVSQYIFNNANQTTLNDTQEANDGTFNGYTFNDGTISGATLNTSGKYGSAYTFDGVNDYINTTFINNFPLNTTNTISAWIKLNNITSAGGGIWSSTSSSTKYYELETYNDEIRLNMRDDDSGGASVTTAVNLIKDTWYHVVGVRNGDDFEIFIDGISRKTKTITGQTNFISHDEMHIGSKSGDYFFDGSIDDIRIYNRSLTTDEISLLYNSGSGTEGTSSGMVTLNAPANNNISYSGSVTYNCSVNVTGGATIENVSLWTNETGVWAIRNTLNPTYDEFDTGTIDTSLWTETTNFSGTGLATISETGGRAKLTTYYNGGEASSVTSCDIQSKLLNLSANTSLMIGIPTYSIYGGFEGSANMQVKLGSDVLLTRTIGYDSETKTGTLIHAVPVNDTQLNYRVYWDGSWGNWTALTYDNSDTIGFFTSISDSTSPYGNSNVEVEYVRFVDTTTILLSSINYDVNRTITAPTLWTCYACDSDDDCAFALENRTVLIDLIAPTINITYPEEDMGVGTIGGNETFNWTATDDNIDTCWYEYNNTNTTVTCSENTTSFILVDDFTNVTFYANDSIGNEVSSFAEWNYTYLENNRTQNTTSYETATETFSINVEGATSATLFYNGTEYTSTKSGNDYTRTIQIPTGNLGNHSVYWRLNGAQNTYTSYQNVSETVFALCNATYFTTFLNISFKDEQNSSIINASIPTSTFNYWLGDGTIYKTLAYINLSANFNYEFCATPNRTLNLNSSVQYKQISNYPQRTYSSDNRALTNITTNITLYLLGISDGIYQEFIILSPSGSVISGVEIIGTRILEGEITNVAIGSTDDTGSATFWLNPDFSHEFTFTKEGYDVFELTYTPTGQSKSIILGGGASDTVIDDITKGISYYLSPTEDFLKKDTNYNFSYTISTDYWTLDSWGFILKGYNGTVISTESSTNEGGGILTVEVNTTDYSKIIMGHYYVVNSTTTNFTRYWKTYSTSEYSLSYLFERTTTYINADIFGILGDDEGQFSKALISVLIILLVVGGIIMRYGINNEAALMGMITGLLVFMNTIGILPEVSIFENAILSFGDLLVYITMIITVGFIIKGERM